MLKAKQDVYMRVRSRAEQDVSMRVKLLSIGCPRMRSYFSSFNYSDLVKPIRFPSKHPNGSPTYIIITEKKKKKTTELELKYQSNEILSTTPCSPLNKLLIRQDYTTNLHPQVSFTMIRVCKLCPTIN